MLCFPFFVRILHNHTHTHTHSKLAGFNLQYDDEELHANVTKWNVMSLRVSKTMNRRHKDIKTVEDFWRALLLRMPFQERFRSYFKE